MARDKETIYQEMLTEKVANPNLSDLTTPSNTGIWQYWLRLFAQFHFWAEQKWDAFKIELQAELDSNQFGTFTWWNQKIKEYQHGDLLMFMNNRFVYAIESSSKQIIHYVSISDERGLVKIKAAKLSNNRPLQLSNQELAGLLSYAREIRPPGTRITVESLPADQLKTRLKISYNAQIGLDAIRPAVEAAYISYINSITFDGMYYVNKMIDVLQAIPGVVEEQVEVQEIAAKQGTDPFIQFTTKYQAKSGYFEVSTDFPLTDTFTYVAV